MPWTSSPDTTLSARIAAAVSALPPTERKVAEAVLADRGAAVEMTAQQLADHVGVSRASVIRAAQALGYQGFPQLRVALAQELASRPPAGQGYVADPNVPLTDALRRRVHQFADGLSNSMSALTEAALHDVVEALDTAERVLVVANGFSAPLGMDLVQRLVSAGRSAEFHTDALTQRIVARGLGENSICFVYSGSGANKPTLEAVRQAQASGARVIAATNFSHSALADIADLMLLVPLTNTTFQDELIHTSRAALMVLTEQLVELFVERRGEQGAQARATVLSLLGDSLQE